MAKLNVSKLARAAGHPPSLIHSRLATGWSLEDALSTPKHARRPIPPTLEVAPEPQTEAKSTLRWEYILVGVVCAAAAAWLASA